MVLQPGTGSLAPVPDDHHGSDRADPFWVKIPSWMDKMRRAHQRPGDFWVTADKIG
jgi:hypothetical protein